MKEATGELNMTVITVVAIAAVAAFFYAFVWPQIQASLALTTACNSVDSKGNYDGQKGTDKSAACKSYTCSIKINGRTTTRNCDKNTGEDAK